MERPCGEALAPAHRAVAVDADDLDRRAAVGLAPPARDARAALPVRHHGHLVAALEARVLAAWAEGHDGRADLVAKDARVREEVLAAVEGVVVSPTHTDSPRLDEHFTLARLRHLGGLPLEAARLDEHALALLGGRIVAVADGVRVGGAGLLSGGHRWPDGCRILA